MQVLIYVFDVTSKDFNGELQYYENCLNALTDLSPKAKIFCLVHKLDLLAESMRDKGFQEKRMKIIEKTKGFEVDCFKHGRQERLRRSRWWGGSGRIRYRCAFHPPPSPYLTLHFTSCLPHDPDRAPLDHLQACFC